MSTSSFTTRRTFLTLFTVLACLAAGLSATRAMAQKTWTGGGDDDNWSTSANWNPAGAPANNTVLVFDGTTRLSNYNNTTAGQDYGLDFAATAGSFTLNGNAIDLRPVTGNVRLRSYSPNVQTINLDLNLIGNTEFTFQDATAYGGSIILNGSITESDGSRNLILWGPYSVTQPERGAFTLTGNNSYSGTTTLGANFRTVDLTLGHANALGTGAVAVPVANNRIQATLDLTGANRIGNAISVNIGGDNALYVAGSHSIEFNGPVSFTTTNNFKNLRNDIVAGQTLTINDLRLTQEGGTNIRPLVVSGTGTTIIGAISQIDGSPATVGRLTKLDSGVLRLQGKNTSIMTEVQINGGVLVMEHADAIPASANIGISFGNVYGILGLGSGNLTRSLGTGTGQLQFMFNSNGGFAAYGADRVVNLGGNATPSQVTWNSGGFVVGTFGLGAASATHTLDFQNPINLNNAVRTVQVDDGAAAVDGILSGVLSGGGSGALVKTGAGTLALTNANTYGGGTTVEAGTLLVNNAGGSGVGTGNVVIDGGTLGGTGFIGTASVTSNVSFGAAGGVLAPGASPGQLTVYGNVDFTSAGNTTFAVDINGTTVGDDYDQLLVLGGGSVTLDASTVLALNWGFTPAVGDTFTIIDAIGGIVGTFAGLPDGSVGMANGMPWQITYGAGEIVLTIIPEPASGLLLALAGLAHLRRRRRG